MWISFYEIRLYFQDKYVLYFQDKYVHKTISDNPRQINQIELNLIKHQLSLLSLLKQEASNLLRQEVTGNFRVVKMTIMKVALLVVIIIALASSCGRRRQRRRSPPPPRPPPPRCTRQNLPPQKIFWLKQNVTVVDFFIYTFECHRFDHKLIKL